MIRQNQKYKLQKLLRIYICQHILGIPINTVGFDKLRGLPLLAEASLYRINKLQIFHFKFDPNIYPYHSKTDQHTSILFSNCKIGHGYICCG